MANDPLLVIASCGGVQLQRRHLLALGRYCGTCWLALELGGVEMPLCRDFCSGQMRTPGERAEGSHSRIASRRRRTEDKG